MQYDKRGIVSLVILLIILGLGVTISGVIIQVAIHSDTEVISQSGDNTGNTTREIIIDVSKTEPEPYEVKAGDTLVLTGFDFNPLESKPVIKFTGTEFNLDGLTTEIVGATEGSSSIIAPEETQTEEAQTEEPQLLTNNQANYIPFTYISRPKSITAEIVEATEDSISVIVPEGTQTGEIQLVVNGQMSYGAFVMVKDDTTGTTSGSSCSSSTTNTCRSSVYFSGPFLCFPGDIRFWRVRGHIIGYFILWGGSPNLYIPFEQVIVNPSTTHLQIHWRYNEWDAPFHCEDRRFAVVPPGGTVTLPAGWYAFFNGEVYLHYPLYPLYPFTICYETAPSDTEPPVVQDITITPSVTNANPTITATVTDTASNITAAEFYGDWVSPVPVTGSATAMSALDGAFDSLTETVGATIDITAVPEGIHTVYIRAKDEANNWSSPYTQTFTIDLTPPTVITATVTPAIVQALTNPGGLTISIDFNETMNTSYEPTVTYDPAGIIGSQPCAGGLWSDSNTYTVTNNNAIDDTTGDGPATVTITAAQDLAGNTSITATATFVININPLRIQNQTATPSTFNPSLGETTTISYVLSEPAQTVAVTTVDDLNNPITLYSGSGVVGINSFTWDASVGSFPVGNYTITFDAANPWETVAVTPKKNVWIRDISVITDDSNIPDPFQPLLGDIATIQFSNINTSNPPVDILMSIKDITGTIITDSGAKYDGQDAGYFGSEQWDGTDAANFAGGGTLVNDGIYYYEIAQINVPPPQRANSKTGTIVLVKDNILEKSSDDGKVTIYYNPATPGLVDIDIQPVDPTTLTDEVKAIVTADPSVYIQSNIYDIFATPPVNFTLTPALLVFQYDPAIAGDVTDRLKLRYWDTILVPPAWVDVPNQRIDLVNKQIIAEITSLSLFALFSGADTTPPVITITSPEEKEYYNLTNGQPTVIPITYTAEDPVIDGVTSGISYTSVILNGQVYTEDTIDLSNLFGENTLTVTAIDGSGNLARKTVRFTVVLSATVTLKPESLKVNPGILTAFVKFPEEYDVADITDATCDGAKYETMELSPDETTMIFKFRRKAVEEALAEKGEQIDTEFEVRGSFKIDQQIYTFKGTDSIKKILSGSVPPEGKGKNK